MVSHVWVATGRGMWWLFFVAQGTHLTLHSTPALPSPPLPSLSPPHPTHTLCLSSQGVQDMTLLEDVSLEGICGNLTKRFLVDEIYVRLRERERGEGREVEREEADEVANMPLHIPPSLSPLPSPPRPSPLALPLALLYTRRMAAGGQRGAEAEPRTRE